MTEAPVDGVGPRRVPRRPGDRTARRLLVAIMTKGGGAFMAFLSFVLLSMSTTTATFGQVGAILALVTIGGVGGSLGLHVAVLRVWPEWRRLHGVAAADRRTGVAARLTLISGTTGAIVTGVVVRIAFDGGFDVAIPAAVLALLLTIAEYASGLLRAQGRDMLGLVPKDVVWRAGTVVVFSGAALLERELSASTCLWAIVACLGCGLVLQAPTLVHQVGFVVEEEDSPAQRRDLISLAAPMWVGALLTACAAQIDVAIVGMFFDGPTAALYVATTRVSALVSLPLVALNQQSGPMIADVFYSNGREPLQQLFTRFMRFSLIAVLGLAAFVGLAGSTMLGLFDVDVDRALPVLGILVVGHAIDAFGGPANMALQMLGRERRAMSIGIAAQAASVIAIVVGVGYDAIIVVALSNVVLQIGRNFPSVVVLRRHEGVDPSLMAMVKR